MESTIARYRARVHPCGVATVGLIPPNKKLAEERERELLATKKVLSRASVIAEGVGDADCIARMLAAGLISLGEAVEKLLQLGLSSPQNSRNGSQNPVPDRDTSGGKKPTKIYGQNGITSFGRLRVKDGAAIMEQEYGRRSLSFGTITLPTMKPRIFKRICSNWGEFVHRILEEIKRELERKQAPLDIVYCSEIQENRYAKYGIVAPHLHLLWYAYDCRDMPDSPRREYAISADWLRDLTSRIISRVAGVKNVNTKASCDIQKVKKSAVGYLGKYMSKGGKIIQKIKSDGNAASLPHQWWGITKELRTKVIKAIRVLENRPAANLFYCADKLKELGLVKSIFHVYSEVKERVKLVNNREYITSGETGEITFKTAFSTADIDNADIATTHRCYGAVLQLEPKTYRIYPVLVSFLDICDDLTDADIELMSEWISATNDAEMVSDVCSIVNAMKEIISSKACVVNTQN